MEIRCDGLCEPGNPGGYACWGWVALDEQGNRISEDCGCVGHGDGMTNNVAEYWALINGASWAMSHGKSGVRFLTDSKLVVEQVNGRWAIRSEQLRPLAELAQLALRELNATLEWIPREQNTVADGLSRQGYQNARQIAKR